MVATTRCMFCKRGPPRVKMTKEHVLRAWFGQQLGVPGSTIEWDQTHVDPGTGAVVNTDKKIPQSPYNMTVREVCDECNAGWLNDEVEGPVGELIVELAKGRVASVDVEASTKLALWASKTACVRARMDKGHRTIPDEHYHWLMQHLTPPPLTSVWITYCDPPPNTWLNHYRFIMTEYGHSIEAHTTTIVLGHMMLFVGGFTEQPETFAPDDIQHILQTTSGNAFVPLWPEPHAFKWPFAEMLSSDVATRLRYVYLEEFLRRAG